MTRWYVYGEAIIGTVEAPNARAAASAAARRFGRRPVRIQSEASAEVTRLELPAELARRLYGREGPGLGFLVPAGPPRHRGE